MQGRAWQGNAQLPAHLCSTRRALPRAPPSAVILIWEDVWHLNNNAALTGWLLSLITAGAVASGVLLPKRFW